MRFLAICCAALMTLGACGPLNEGSAVQGVVEVVKARFSGEAPAPTVAPTLTLAQVDAQPGGFLIFNAYGGGIADALVVAGANGNRVTWLGGRQIAITVENGIIVATRGLPRDLMAAQVNGVRQAIANGGGTGSRVHETLTDQDQISRELLQCSIAFKAAETVVILGEASATRKFEEACKGENLVFTNTYWVDGGGQIAKSRQVISPAVGFVQLERP